jgi:hypothetical protein
MVHREGRKREAIRQTIAFQTHNIAFFLKQKPLHPRKGPQRHSEGNMVFQMEVPQIILPKEGMPMLSLEHGVLGTLSEDIFIRVNQHDLHKT